MSASTYNKDSRRVDGRNVFCFPRNVGLNRETLWEYDGLEWQYSSLVVGSTFLQSSCTQLRPCPNPQKVINLRESFD